MSNMSISISGYKPATLYNVNWPSAAPRKYKVSLNGTVAVI